jgi:SAM-dependent methyltransferase
MTIDDRYDELVTALGGFYRTWIVYLGIELGYFRAIARAGEDGIAADALADACSADPRATKTWTWAATAHQLVEPVEDRFRLDPELAAVLLDDDRPEFLGGQFVHSVVASLDWDAMVEFFRTGQAIAQRPDRYRAAIEAVTKQDIAVFFQEALAALPELVVSLSRPARVLDVHCGGGRWLVAMAKRFPDLELVGVEAEPDSLARARRAVSEAGLDARISVEQLARDRYDRSGTYDFVYYQYALHFLPDPAKSLAASWRSLRPDGWLVVQDWPLPSSLDELQTIHGELVAGVQLDEVFMGAGLRSHEAFRSWFREADLPDPEIVDLPSGATVFVVRRPA